MGFARLFNYFVNLVVFTNLFFYFRLRYGLIVHLHAGYLVGKIRGVTDISQPIAFFDGSPGRFYSRNPGFDKNFSTTPPRFSSAIIGLPWKRCLEVG
jgi:hypothetical protein